VSKILLSRALLCEVVSMLIYIVHLASYGINNLFYLKCLLFHMTGKAEEIRRKGKRNLELFAAFKN